MDRQEIDPGGEFVSQRPSRATQEPSSVTPTGPRRAAGARARLSPGSPDSESHRRLEAGEFWRRIPAYSEVEEDVFLDHQWQARSSVRSIAQLRSVLREFMPNSLHEAVSEGLRRAPMSMRLSPYVISLIDWSTMETDPIRRQFLPLAVELLPDHPMARLDSLAEQDNSPVAGLVHRYHDKALFLTQDRCPVYCRFCTRSYAVGLDTEDVQKQRYGAQRRRWEAVFEYLRTHAEVEDVVVSGGDCYSLRADHLRFIGESLLDIAHIRRIRFATKGPAVIPMKLLTDEPWFDALRNVAHHGRRMVKEVCVHTHFNHPREITDITRRACARLFQAGIVVRNQSVLLRGVNDQPDTMRLLAKRLGFVGVQPYYVYQHDLVTGVEDLRTSMATAIELEKQVRGATAGFLTPAFVIDVPGGGGKRDVHSHEFYDPVTGVSVYRSPNKDADAHFLYFDPIDQLPEAGRKRWAEPGEHASIVREALES